jgi:hypothetical protein
MGKQLGSILDDEDYAEKELENQAFFREGKNTKQ